VNRVFNAETQKLFTEVGLKLRTNRIEEMFKHGLTHGVADVVLARIFAVLPVLTAAEVEQLGDVVKY